MEYSDTIYPKDAEKAKAGIDGCTLFIFKIPVEIVAYVMGQGTNPPGWDEPTRGLYSWRLATRVTIPAAFSSAIRIGIVRDMHAVDTITYEDGSTSINDPQRFLTDSLYPNYITPTRDNNGNLQYIVTDSPATGATIRERPYIKEIKEEVSARNFVLLSYKQGAPITIGEVPWGYVVSASGTPSPLNSSTKHFPSTMLTSLKQPSPPIGTSTSGAPAAHTFITTNRQLTEALFYQKNDSNWTPSVGPASMAHTYSRNP